MFRVIWMPAAFDQMHDIIRSNPSRKAEFAAALRSITAALMSDPEGTGESRDTPLRVHFFDPVTVTFRAALGQRTVYVTRVHLPS